MNQELTYKLSKHLTQGLVIFLFLKFVPRYPMSNLEIFLITIVIILSYAILENLYYMIFKPSECEKTCSLKEGMNSVGQISAQQSSKIQYSQLQPSQLQPSQLQQLQQPSQLQPSQLQPSQLQPSQLQQLQPSQQESVYSSIQSELNTIKIKGINKNSDGSYTIIPINNPQTQSIGSRQNNGVMNASDEMSLNYIDFNTLPNSPSTDIFSPGHSYLPPINWYPTPAHPPVCVTEKQCPVCPVYTEGTNIDLLNWDNSRRISPPDNINTQFIESKLNSGR